jgi:hypothetical protein
MSKINPFKDLPDIVRKKIDPPRHERLQEFWRLKMQLVEIGKGYVKELERHQTVTKEQKSEVSLQFLLVVLRNRLLTTI